MGSPMTATLRRIGEQLGEPVVHRIGAVGRVRDHAVGEGAVGVGVLKQRRRCHSR